MFTKNMGSIDRAARVVVALALGYAYMSGMVTGTLGVIALVIAAIFILTSIVGNCPLYTLLGVRTCPADTQ